MTAFNSIPTVGFFGLLPEGERELLFSYGHVHPFAKDEVIIRQGTPSQSLQMVLKGTLKAERSSELAIVMLGLVTEGHLIGEISLLDGQRASATIKALEDGERWCLERIQFERFLEEQPSGGIRLLRYISQELALRVRQSNEQLVRAWEGPFGFDADY